MNVSEISSFFITPGMEWKHDSPEQDCNVKEPEHIESQSSIAYYKACSGKME